MDARVRRDAGAGMSGAPAACEGAFRATGHAARHQIRARDDRKAPTGSPDGWRRRPRRG
ncbi:hypothetical protein [Streptomyces sp. YKOK-I1]